MENSIAYWLTWALFALTYAGLALGKVPGLRMDRAGIALVGATAMLVTGLLFVTAPPKIVCGGPLRKPDDAKRPTRSDRPARFTVSDRPEQDDRASKRRKKGPAISRAFSIHRISALPGNQVPGARPGCHCTPCMSFSTGLEASLARST